MSSETDLPIESLRAVRQFISDNWEKTFCHSQESGVDSRDLPLPMPYVVPTAGQHFHSLFYWDSYFTGEGLLRDGRQRMARNTAENLIHLTETLGYIPSRARKDFNRSHPPLSSFFYKAIYEHFGDRTWLRRACRALEVEHAFWMSQRTGPHGLNRYLHHHTPLEVRNFYWAIRDRMCDIPEDPQARLTYLAHKLAEAESGWDFNPRFAGHAMNYYAVDLNCLLYAMENHIADFLETLGDLNAPTWRARANERLRLMNKFLWNEEQGMFLDYDFVDGRHSKIFSAASYYALFCGVATPEQAQRMKEHLPRLETGYGVDTCEPGERTEGVQYQWDSPNAWAPFQIVTIGGLQRYGFDESARRIAGNYVHMLCRVFEETGNLWEKYNARTGRIDVADEYPMPPMLGWTAGAFLYALDSLDQLQATIPQKTTPL